MTTKQQHTPGLEAPQPWRDWINGLRADNADLENDCIALRARIAALEADNAQLREALHNAAHDVDEQNRGLPEFSLRAFASIAAQARAALAADRPYFIWPNKK